MGTDLSDGNGHQRDSYSVGPYQGALLRGVTEGGGGGGGGGRWDFSPATKSMAPGYFHRKQEENRTKR